jgi:hypothetical protein
MATLIKIGNYYYDEEEFQKIFAPRIKTYTEEEKEALNTKEDITVKDFSTATITKK